VAPISTNRLAYLDGIRAVAILEVVYRHVWDKLGPPEIFIPTIFGTFATHEAIYNLQFGINLFFVLSAFLLSQIWLRAWYTDAPKPDYFYHLGSRFLRILPAYYLAVLLSIAIVFRNNLGQILDIFHHYSFQLLTMLTLTHTLFPTTTWAFDNPVLWTLTITAIFYLLLPLLVLATAGKRWYIFLPVAFLVSIGWYVLSVKFAPSLEATFASSGIVPTVEPEKYLARQFPAYLFDFTTGITLANMYVRKKLEVSQDAVAEWPVRPTLSSWFAPIGLIILAGVGLAPDRGTLLRELLHIPMTLAWGLILASVLFGRSSVLRTLLSWKPLRIIGIISYSVYLCHWPILRWVFGLAIMQTLSYQQLLISGFTIVVIFIITCGMVLYVLIERPFLKAKSVFVRNLERNAI